VTAPRFAGRKVVITAGPTHEPIDADHFISTHDTGQLGYKLAEAAIRSGAQTVLVSGPVDLPLPPGVQVMPVNTAPEMLSTCERELPCDIAILAATVAKWRVANEGAPYLELSRIDIAKTIGTRRDARPIIVVGFSTERADPVENGRKTLREAGCDLILVEDASPEAESLISDRVTIHLISSDKVETWSRLGRKEIVRRLMEVAAARLAAGS
jgi:phosphopantothenoylcysteine decarboxylase / phosphopantothenate---cysteine ligase